MRRSLIRRHTVILRRKSARDGQKNTCGRIFRRNRTLDDLCCGLRAAAPCRAKRAHAHAPKQLLVRINAVSSVKSTQQPIILFASAGCMKFWIMNHLINPLVRAVLYSPHHRLLSGSLAVVTYTGRMTGRRYSVPVMYVQRKGQLVVFAGRPQEKRWWRNLRGGAPVSVVLRGQQHQARAEVIMDDNIAVRSAWEAYSAKFPKATETCHEAIFVQIFFAKTKPDRF